MTRSYSNVKGSAVSGVPALLQSPLLIIGYQQPFKDSPNEPMTPRPSLPLIQGFRKMITYCGSRNRTESIEQELRMDWSVAA